MLSTFIDGYKYTRIRPSFKKEYRRLASPLLLEFLYQFRDGVILGSFEFSGELFPFGESAAREEARRREIYRFGWAKKRFEIDQGGFDRGMEQETEDGGKESGESLGVSLEKEWGEGDPRMG